MTIHTGISQRDYIDPIVFEREQQRVFQTLWIFAGFRTLLAEPDSFLTRTIGGIPIVIQNFSGTLKAFRNQCAHRQAPLQFEEYGRRRLVCRYHGWSFDETGVAKGIPYEQRLYQYNAEERGSLCLQTFALECIGNLIFVNLAADPLPIEEQFDAEFRTRLEHASGHLAPQAIHAVIPSAYNWKLNFENVLDSNHVPFVHPQTFRPLMERGGPKDETPYDDSASAPVDRTVLSDLSFLSITPLKIQSWPWHALVDRFGEEDVYYNFFIYPNVNFISVGGFVFLAQQFDPISPSLTHVRFTLATAAPEKRLGALPAILWGHLKGEKRVLDEDKVILESLQQGLHAEGAPAAHGRYEKQLKRVAFIYRQLMGQQDEKITS